MVTQRVRHPKQHGNLLSHTLLTFVCIVLFAIPFKIHFAHILQNLRQLHILVGIFVQPLRIGHIILGLYRAARETAQFQVPAPKTQAKKPKLHQI